MTILVKSMSRNPSQAATSVITLRYLLVSLKFVLSKSWQVMVFSGKVVNFSPKSFVIPASFQLKWNFGMTPEWRNEAGMIGMKSRKTTFFPNIWDDRNDGNVFRMTKIIIPTSSLSFRLNFIPCHSTARMTMECMEWHPNEGKLSTWTMINGMTLKWWNDIPMMELYLNEQGMTEWHGNDGML